MKKHILLVGNIQGAYRSQILIKHLLDFRGSDEYVVDFALDSFYVRERPSRSSFGKGLRRVYVILLKFLSIFGVFVKAGFSDVIYILPLNHGWMPIVLMANFFWKRPVISDIYVSRYDTGLDWGIYRHRNQLRAQYDRFLDRAMIEKSNTVIFSNSADFDFITRLVGVRPEKANKLIVPLAVERRALANPSASEDFRLCWWGTWLPVHGLHNIFGAVRLLRDRGVSVVLDLLGTASDERKSYLRMIEEMGLSECVRVHVDKTFANGRLEPFLQRQCDLVLGMFGDSAKAHHSMPNKILEGCAMRLPVITMRSTALGEFIDTDNDIFVCDNDPASLAESIETIMKDPEERQRRALAGHQRFLSTFTPEMFCARLEQAIDGVIPVGSLRPIATSVR